MRETDPDMQKTSPWLIAARVIFTFALIACIVFIFSNSMQIGDVSETASGRVLLLMKKVFTRLGMPGVANHLTDHIVRKLHISASMRWKASCSLSVCGSIPGAFSFTSRGRSWAVCSRL